MESRPLEIQDTYEKEPLSSRSGVASDLRVVLPAPAGDFDRDAYAIALASSQSQAQGTQRSTQSALVSSQLQTPARKKSSFIWDEDIEGEILDSVGQPGSSSYKPSDTLATRTSVPTRLDTETTTEAVSDSVDFRTTQSSSNRDRSGTIGSYLAEPGSLLTAESYRGTQLTSTQDESSIVGPQTTQQNSPSWRELGDSESQSIELPNRQTDEAVASEDSGTHSIHSQSPQSRNFTDSQYQSSLRFLTQIPLSSSPPPEATGSGSNGTEGGNQDFRSPVGPRFVQLICPSSLFPKILTLYVAQ